MKFYTNIGIAGNFLYVRGYENGKAFKRKVEYRPYLFVPDVLGEYSTLDGQPVTKITFDSLNEGRNYHRFTVDETARLERIQDSARLQNKYGRFPSKVDNTHQIYGLATFQYLYLLENYGKGIKYDPQLIKVGTIDIETSTEGGFPDIDEANREITAITMRVGKRIVALGCGDFEPPADSGVTYIQCKNEDELLYKFLDIWEHFDVDVITGWNIEFFDIPYIINRIRRQIGEEHAKRLSPWGILEKRSVTVFNREHTVYNPMGINVIDYLQAYRKFGYTTQESYKLDHIAFMELDERKLDYSQYESLGRLHRENFQLYMEYNVKDVNLVYRLDEKLKILELIYAMAYDALVNYADAFTTVRMWDVLIHNDLMKQKIVIPHNDVSGRKEYEAAGQGIQGAYVKDPQVGMHRWVVSEDFDSLYPHIIMMYNLSPETMIGVLENAPSIDAILAGAWAETKHRKIMDERNATITVNGVVFSRDKQGFLPRLMKKMYTDRSAYKKKMIKAKQAYEKSHSFDDLKLVAQLNNLQMSKKIQLNSGYGALANVYFRWFDPRIAEAITTCGQLSTRWVEKAVNQKLNEFLQTEGVDYIIAADTDSMYLNLGPVVDKLWPECTVQEQVEHVDRFTKNYVQTWIDEAVEALTKYVNAYALEMRMKREAIANKGIWSAKKRYVLNMYDLEGVRFEEPKLKIMGSEAIRSSTPTAVRQQIKDTFALIMNTDEKTVQQSIKEFRKKFKELPFEDIAFPRGCNGIAKWTDIDGTYRSSCPIHVKGAIMYNKLLRDRGLDKTLSPIMEGEKIKFIYMKTPNPLQVAVLSVPGNLPRQLNLEQYVDYDTQFEKAFLEPISGVLGKIGWRAEKLNTLTQFIQ